MKEKKEFYYTLAVFVFIISLWLVFFFIPKMIEIRKLGEESENYKAKIAFALEAAGNMAQLEKNSNDLNIEVKLMRNKLIHNPSLNHIVEMVRQAFKIYNVKIHHISPVMSSYLSEDKKAGEGFFYRLPLEMKLEAKFMDFVHLLDNSEKFVFFLNPDQLSMVKNQDSGSTLLIDFKASVFVSKDHN